MEKEFRKIYECEQGTKKCIECIGKDKCEHFQVIEIVNGVSKEIKDKEIEKAIADLIDIMTNFKCQDVKIGSYDCYVSTNYGFDVDMCLLDEINDLNNIGIETIGCCCGHNQKQGFIQVAPRHINMMLNLKYEKLSLDENNHGVYCFKPKTILPY